MEDVTQGRAKKADRVMLNRKYIHTKWPVEKLNHQMFGPFVVLQKIGRATYKLPLPECWGIHSVFNVGLLEPYLEEVRCHRAKEVPIPYIFDNEPSYVIERVLDSCWYGGTKQKFPQRFVQYLVAWEGYGLGENS